MAEVSKLSWLVPGFSSSALICFHEILIRACTNRYGISPEDFTLTWLMSGGLFCAHSPGPTPPHTAQQIPALGRALLRGALRAGRLGEAGTRGGDSRGGCCWVAAASVHTHPAL